MDMKEATPHGSIIYKILIVILSVALVATIIYPHTLWKQEAKRTKQCRDNMEHILYAELTYNSESGTGTYNDTLSKVINFIIDDSTGRRVQTFTKYDSILTEDIFKHLRQYDAAAAIIDTLLEYGRRYDIDTTEIRILDSLRTFPQYARQMDSIAIDVLDNMTTCPTVNKPYRIEVVDTSVIKVINIYCPLNADDSLAVTRDFKLSKLGGLRITNHGSIENMEKVFK